MTFRILIALALILAAFLLVSESRAQVAPRPEQPHPDVFDCGVANCQTLNPLTIKAKATRAATYRLILMPGCVSGTVPSDMLLLEGWLREVGFNLTRNDTAYDFTNRINCGTEQIRICGGTNIFCLNRGFPYVPDVEISDIISQWPLATRLSILCHEICGHAIGTWNEQYCLGSETTGICKGLTLFTSAPNWRDFMNTGELSRHGFEAIERERWERTMYTFQVPTCDGGRIDWGATYDICRNLLVGDGPWDFNLITGTWQDKQGASEWCCQQSYGGIYNRRLDVWEWRPATVWNWRGNDPVWRCSTGCP